MQYTEIMIRYGELSTKGKNRKDFINRLASNVQKVLHDFPDLKIQTHHDRMHILLNGTPFEPVNDRLKVVFGIQTYSPVIKTEKSLEAIEKTALDANLILPGMACAVIAIVIGFCKYIRKDIH